MSDDPKADTELTAARLRHALAMAQQENKQLLAQLERLRVLLDRSADALMLHDGQGRILDANRTAWESLGYGREEFIGMNIRDLDVSLAQIPLERYGQNWAKMKPGVVVNDESELKHRDGHLIPIEVRVQVHEEAGQRFFVGGCRDITARRRAEEERAQIERRFRSVFEDSPLAMLMVGRSGDLLRANPAACKLLGYGAAELTTMTIADITEPEDRHLGREELAALWAGTRDHMQVEKRYRTRAGRTIWAKLSAFRDLDADGSTVQTVATIEDISERRRAEREREEMFERLEVLVAERTSQLTSANTRLRDEITERQRTQEELSAAKLAAEEANRAKSQFLASMSHELRTPLNAVIGYSEMLQEDAEDVGQPEMIPDLEKIRGAGKHLLGIINDILDLSKVEAGKMELFFEDANPRDLVRTVLSTIRPLADKNRNQVVLEMADDLGTMRTDVTRLQQILFNLLSNACKFTEEGTVTFRAGSFQRRGAQWIRFEVSDTGIGISTEQIARLFNPFTQADASTTRKYGGTGLGLSISHRFADMLGGGLSVTSTPGEGSTFTVEVPVDAEPEERGSGPVMIGNGPLVLVVDDDADARELMTRTLSREGYRVLVAETGDEAIALARQAKPDVITLDVIMPGRDGWSVLGELKSDESLRDVPVVLVTMLRDPKQGYSLGAADFVSKPVERDQLMRVLDRVTRGDGPQTVLVVDDDPEAREMVRRALERDGWGVVMAENGRVAMDRMRQLVPTVVLLDLMMPEMDGFAVIEEMRGDPTTASIPVVVFTAADLLAADRERLRARVRHVIQKGGRETDSLLDEVRRMVRQHTEPTQPD